MAKSYMLHATVVGKAWSGYRAKLDIVKPLKRDKPLKEELQAIMKACGDFQRVEGFTDDSYISIHSNPVSNMRIRKVVTVEVSLEQLPSLKEICK